MATVLPAMPTDSLYKFIALFGVALLGFGLFFPDEKVAQASAEARISNKARQLAKIRLDRKNAQNSKLVEEIKLKSAALADKEGLLEETKATLDAKLQLLKEQLARMDSKTLLPGGKEVARGVMALKSDTEGLHEKVRQYSDEVKKLIEDYKPVQVRQEEFSDEMAAEIINLKTDNEALEEQTVQLKWWTVVMCASMLIGVAMIFVGFTLWYVKIQVHQDVILREQAASRSSSRVPTGLPDHGSKMS
jgi:hypothetical protein